MPYREKEVNEVEKVTKVTSVLQALQVWMLLAHWVRMAYPLPDVVGETRLTPKFPRLVLALLDLRG